MSRGVSHSIKTTTSLPVLDCAGSTVKRGIEEVQGIRGVVDAQIWFADERWFRNDTGGAERGRDEEDHPSVRSFETGQPIVAADEDRTTLAVTVPGAHAPHGVIVATLDAGVDPDPPTFEIGAIATRVGMELDDLRREWAIDRMELGLEFAETACLRFQNETSLHRAIRLGLTDLAELAGARETQLWCVDDENEFACLAQPAGGNPSADRDRAIRRLVSVVGDAPGNVRVPDTASSPHYGWLLDEGIRRFVTLPVRAHDRFFGVVVVVDFVSAPALGTPGLVPGLESAAGVFVGAIGAALYHAHTQEFASESKERLKELHRRMEAGERDSARYELCRLAATELRRVMGSVAADLPQVEEPLPEPVFRDRLAELGRRLDVGENLLNELALLTERPPARLTLASINAVIHQVVAEIEEDGDIAPMRVSRRLQGDLPELLLDEAQVAVVLKSLLAHGTSGTEQREAIIVTRLQKGDVIVEVTFPERIVLGGVLESLFQPFQGLVEGTGLPLSLADQVVGEHGGQLRARSESGDGLVYWLSLPVAENLDRRNRRSDRRGRRDRRDFAPDAEG